MKLYISDITDSIQTLSLQEEFIGELFNYESKMLSQNISLEHYKAGDTLCLTFKGSFEIESICNRCAEAIAAAVEFSEQFILLPENKSSDSDYIYCGDFIELSSLLHEALVLNIPRQIFCKDDCKGRCIYCGTNLNDKDCYCSQDINSNR